MEINFFDIIRLLDFTEKTLVKSNLISKLRFLFSSLPHHFNYLEMFILILKLHST